MPKHILERDGDLTQPKSIIGTGPFKFKRYVRGNVIEWERNENYYNPKLPYLDGVKQFILVERSPQVAAAKAGQIMLWNAGPPMRKGRGGGGQTGPWEAATSISGRQAPLAWCICITRNPL